MAATAPLIWINGRRADPAGPHVSAFDRGYMRADGLFETLRSYDGTAGCLERHMARLRRGAAVLGIAVPEGIGAMVAEAAGAAAAEGWADAAVRLSLSRGLGDLTMAPRADAEPTVVITATPLSVQASAPLYEKGIGLHVASGTRNEKSVTSGVKTLGYAEAVIAFNAAIAAGFDEALFLDTEEHVSEATTANIFAVRGGELLTPPLTCGILAGITRELVLEIAGREQIPATERVMRLDDLHGADEIFITSSVRELMPVTRVGQNVIGPGKPGPVYKRLHEIFAAVIRACR
ncbi:MAG TPA: aminotransferase class IV [Gemmatimonadaceae bacterium]|nr:aminotransferase class IV [Gemmatimonadaceae bacterium]